MNSVPKQHSSVLSGMRPTGRLHLGHYHGVLQNWIRLQHEYDCYFFVADWHALTTHYEDPSIVPESVWDMVIDWLAAGIDPDRATLFIQSRVPEHAELHLLLSMLCPLGWLERVPSYKDQQEKLKQKDLATYGFLGYPLLQSADILIYKAGQVPVGEDQVAHVELTREIARRFNHLYGREPDFEAKAEQAAKKMGKKNAKAFERMRRAYQEQGDQQALADARALLASQQNIGEAERERLFGYLEGGGQGDPAGAPAPAHQGLEDAGAGRPEDVQVLRQYHLPARRAGAGRKGPANHAHRHQPGAPRRPRRPGSMPGVAVSQDLLQRRGARLGAGRMPFRRDRLYRMQAAGNRRRIGRDRPDPGAGSRVRGPAPAGTTDRRGRLRSAPGRWPGRPWTKCAAPCRCTTRSRTSPCTGTPRNTPSRRKCPSPSSVANRW